MDLRDQNYSMPRHTNGKEIGTAQAIKAALNNRARLSRAQIFAACPAFKPKQIASALNQLVQNGGVASDHKRPSTYWRRSNPSGTVLSAAAPPEFKPLRQDMLANWRLCERAPFDAERDVAALVR